MLCILRYEKRAAQTFEQSLGLLQAKRYCKSAIAAIDAASNKMTCVKISSVTSNIDEHKAPQKLPGKCSYVNGDPSACKYMYKDKTGKE